MVFYAVIQKRGFIIAISNGSDNTINFLAHQAGGKNELKNCLFNPLAISFIVI